MPFHLPGGTARVWGHHRRVRIAIPARTGRDPRRPAIKAEPSDQQKLLALQALDTETAHLNHRRTSLPEHADIARLLAERKGLLAKYTEAETRVSDLSAEQTKAEADLEPVRARRVRNQQRVDSGSVDAKALPPLLDEIEHLGRRISDLEDAELELMEQLEEATARFEEVRARRTGIEDEIRGLMAERDRQIAGLDSELQHIQANRETVVEKLPAALVGYYERIRDKHSGLGAAEIVQRRCGGCRLDLTAADVAAFGAAAPDELLTCEECGRILIRTAQSGLSIDR